MKSKEGFISMTLVYTFLILFLFLMLGIMAAYAQKNKFLKAIDEKIRNDVETYVVDNFGREWEYSYTGNVQTFVAPQNGYYKIELWGATGLSSSSTPGKGAYTSGIIELAKEDTLYIYVGQMGQYVVNGTTYNGGTATSNGWPGGGATDVRTVSGAWNETSSLISRIMVAGGGGTSSTNIAGDGGRLFGLNGGETRGGTPSGIIPSTFGGSSFGIAGGGCSGGNGYYPAAGANCSGGPGGGSSYISGYAGVNSVDNSTVITHNRTTKHYSGKYFIAGYMASGINTDNGKAKISYVSTDKPIRINTVLDEVRYIRDCSTGSNANEYSIWVEIQAIVNGTNIIKNLTLTGVTNPTVINDGDIASSENYGYLPVVSDASTCITIDLGSTYNIDELAVWNYYTDSRTFDNAITSVSLDGTVWRTVINIIEADTNNGKRINAYIN